MDFVLHRDFTHASALGHAIEFKKGVPTMVPPALYAEVRAIGAVPEGELPEEAGPVTSTEPTDPTKRADDILAAISLMADRNDRNDFSATGAPRVPALAAVLGWKPTTQERDQLWARFQVDKD